MKTKGIRIVLTAATLCMASLVQADAMDDARRNFARVLDMPQTKDLLESYVRKSNPYDHLSPELSEMIAADKGLDHESLSEKAIRLDLAMAGQDVSVRLWPGNQGELGEIRRKVGQLGGEIEIESGGALYANIPVSSLEELNDVDALEFAEPQMIYRANYSNTAQIGEGVRASGVEPLHQAGITGQQVKIGILDFGFSGYDALRTRGEVPQPVEARAFNSSGDLGGGDVVHGTACAEIIHDMAPDAQIYLAAVGNGGSSNDADIIRAARWLAEQRVDIINFSGGGHAGPTNGSAPLDQLVDEISRQGILWTVSAGNEGRDHWLGATRDNNGNELVDVPGNSKGDFLLIEHPGGPLQIIVAWDDWGAADGPPAASTDIDVFLLGIAPNGQAVVVGQSTNPQNGRGRPIEMLGGSIPPGVYGLVLKASTLRSAHPLHVIVRGARALAPTDPSGSVASPGSAASALTVGAVHAVRHILEPYSSNGPTDDGRVKPEVVAPDNNSSLAYSGHGGKFPGTSAAAPHVAGFAALVKQTAPRLNQAELRELVIRFARELERPAPNNRVGYGHIDGGKVRTASGEPAPLPPHVQPQPPQGDAGVKERLRPIAPLLDLLSQ